MFASLGACSAEPIETTHGGSMRQFVTEARFGDVPPTRLILIVDGSATAEAAQVRARVVRAVDQAAAALSSDPSSPPARWAPIDIEARIMWIGARTIRSSAEDARLLWREEQATDRGAATLARGIAEAISSTPPPDVEPTRAIDTVRMALELTPPVRGQQRIVVLATSHDDPTAAAERETSLEAADHPRVLSILPTMDDDQEAAGCAAGVEGWHLVEWLRKQTFADFHDCGMQRLDVGHRDSGMRRISGPVAIREDGTPACRVRVRVSSIDAEVETRCDPRRGWFGPVAVGASPEDASLTCDVMMLTGEDGSRCRDRGSACPGCASGWCIREETDPVTNVTTCVAFRQVPASMSANGANASNPFFTKFDAGGGSVDHRGFLNRSELKLIAEWLDVGAQYYNNPFAAPED